MTKASRNHYQSMVDNASFTKFACLKHFQDGASGSNTDQHVPSIEEVVAHLKLLKAFQLLKIKIVGKPGDIGSDGSFINFTDRQIKYWQAFLSNASRRFIIYMSAVKYKFKKNYPHVDENKQLIIYRNDPNLKLISEFINRVSPPLDILMIWHSFTLNPKAFYDNGVRNNLIEFTLCPFPLFQILKLIDDNSFIYQPSSSVVKEFHDFTRHFGVALEFEYIFDLGMALSINCPICGEILVPRSHLTNINNLGFADPGFSTIADGNCTCIQYNPSINHEELRFRQLHSDLVNNYQVPRFMPNIVKKSSRLLNRQPKYSNEKFDQMVKNSTNLILSTMMCSNDWKQFISHIQMYLEMSIGGDEIHKILLDYEQMNLLHLTIPPTNKGPVVEISEDLVSMTVRQERFIMKMNSFDLLNSKVYLNQSVNESINRYLKFFMLMTENYMVSMLVPTLDIDLIWHTHQLSPIYYIQYSRSVTPERFVVGHDDKVDEETLSSSFQQTGNMFYQKYGEHYYYCPCSFCNETPQDSRPIVKSLFSNTSTINNNSNGFLNNSTSTLLRISNSDTNTNASHISAHNAVRRNGLSGTIKKKQKTLKTILQPFPWNDWNAENRALNKYGSFFVLQPINEENSNCINASETYSIANNRKTPLSNSSSRSNSSISSNASTVRRHDSNNSIQSMTSRKSYEGSITHARNTTSDSESIAGWIFD